MKSKIYPKIFKTWFGPKLAIVLSDFELIKKVLTANQFLHKPAIFYDVLQLPYGLIGSKCKLTKFCEKKFKLC
jgi:hypothetical protein